MNGDLEKRLSDHIEDGALFQGKMLAFVDNFNERVLPQLVTTSWCDARRHTLKTELATGELDEAKENRQRWRNRLWGILVAVLFLVLGAVCKSLLGG